MIDIHYGPWENTLRDVSDVSLVFTSPPYNIGSKSPRRDGYRKRGKYDPKNYGGITGYMDSMPQADYEEGQVRLLEACRRMLAHDGVIVYNHKPRRVAGKMVHPLKWIFQVPDLDLAEEIIWDRGSTHNHCNKLLWPTTERLYVLRRSGAPYRFRNTDDLPFRKDLWHIPLSSRPVNGHACPFTITLAVSVVQSFTSPGELVCDPYSGSGTTAVACKQLGRRFVGSEQNRQYHRQSLKRVMEAA